MTAVGIFEAKNRLPNLVERICRGESFLITKRGKPVAQLVSAEVEPKPDVKEVIRQMKAWREKEGPTLGPDLTIRDLMETGRRF